VPPAHIDLLRPLPEGFVATAIPEDPLADPRRVDVEFLIGGRDGLGSSVYAEMPSLRVVQSLSAGVERIIESIPPHVTLCTARGAHDTDVAEWVVGAILAGQRYFADFRDAQVAERWERRSTLRLSGSTVLFVGYGSIARAVEARLGVFGARFLRIARTTHPGVESVEDLADHLALADIVVVLTPVTPETHHLIDAAALRAMRPGALLVNAGRGEVLDQHALLEAASTGHVRAVLDVTTPEPLPPGHPLYRTPGIFLTPHVAGMTDHALGDVYDLVDDQLYRYARGEPLRNVVEHGY
jgi:phosphoglycerate dehydrogenase-like enzyme